MSEDDETYSINYAKIADEKDLLSVTRLLAIDLSANSYMSVGEFLKNLSNGDLQHLIDIIDEYTPEDQTYKNLDDLMLIAGMLSAAEGLGASTIDEYQKYITSLMTFIVCESLYRKGMIKIYRENMSFGEDMADKLIAEKLDD